MQTHKQYIVRRKLRARFGGISEMTLWRWENDAKLAFPKALIINGRRYYDVSALEEWERGRGMLPKFAE